MEAKTFAWLIRTVNLAKLNLQCFETYCAHLETISFWAPAITPDHFSKKALIPTYKPSKEQTVA
jgi:hypothetical protein